VLAVVVCALALSAALPMREYLAQRGRIAELERAQAAALARVEALEAERDRLQDPAYIKAEARRRLQFVMPGETAYVVLAPEGLEQQAAESEAARDAPWYAQVWETVREADRPSPPPSTAQATPSPAP
jgi:hypothetical protein